MTPPFTQRPFAAVDNASAEASSLIDGMRAATVGSSDASREVLVFMGFLACVEPFEIQRFSLLAREWHAHVTVVDTPGCGYGGARLTHPERRGLRRGDFTLVARRIVETAQAHHHRLRSRPVIVVGYSMGASLAASAAADPGLLRVSDMVLVEPVAMRRWSLLRLIRSVRAEDRALDDYLNQNLSVPDAVLPTQRRDDPPPLQSRTDLAHLGYALSRGRIARDLMRANAIQSFPLQIVHGTDSRLSRAGDAQRLTAICRRAGFDVRDVPIAGGHALWHSLPDVAALAKATLKRWPDQA